MLFLCPDKISEKLMREYHLSWSEFFEATKPPLCVIWRKDPITGIPMFPKEEDYAEEDFEKYSREDIKRYFSYCDFEKMKNLIMKKYNMYGDYFYRIIGNNMSEFENNKPIEIWKKWCLKIERYFKKHDKEYKYIKKFTLKNVEFLASKFSVEAIMEKLNLTEEEAKKCLESGKKLFIFNSNGMRRKELDNTSYSELFIRPEDKEEIYHQVIELIDKESLSKISKDYLMKFGFNYNASSIILDVLMERGYLEESNKIGTFNVLQ
jgi:hypothetical protein